MEVTRPHTVHPRDAADRRSRSRFAGLPRIHLHWWLVQSSYSVDQWLLTSVVSLLTAVQSASRSQTGCRDSRDGGTREHGVKRDSLVRSQSAGTRGCGRLASSSREVGTSIDQYFGGELGVVVVFRETAWPGQCGGLTVAGERPIPTAIARTPAPPKYRSAICNRSSKDRNRPDGSGRLRGIRPPVACRHLRPVALLTPTASLAPVNVEPPAINTQNRACLSIRSFFNDIHNTFHQNGVATTD